MPTAFDYLEMASECLKEAEATRESGRSATLSELARLYTRAALCIEGTRQQDNEQTKHK